MSCGVRMTFKPENFSELESTLDEIYSIAGSDSYMRDMLINEKLAHLLMLIMNESWHPEETEDSEVRHDVAEICSYINANYQSPMTLETIAQKFFISKNYLAHLFREQCGVTINSYIQQVRVRESRYYQPSSTILLFLRFERAEKRTKKTPVVEISLLETSNHRGCLILSALYTI